MHNPLEGGKHKQDFSEDVEVVIHQVIRAASRGGDRVNKNERVLQKMGQSNMVTHWK